MALTDPTNRVVATGNGATTNFPFNKQLYDSSHLVLYLDGVVQASGYTVNGVPGTSTSVDITPAPANGVQVLLLRVVPHTQLAVYDVGGAFPAKTTEKNLDLAVMQLQDLSETVGRAVTLPVTSTLTSTNLPDPALPANYGMGVKIKGDGTGLDTFLLSATPYAGVLTTKGDVAVFSSAADRLPVGTNGKVLQADSTQGTGLKWTGDQPDNVFRVVGSSDVTKKVALEVDGLTTATTRTLTVQDKDGTLALTSELVYSTLAGTPGRLPFSPKLIQGLTYANNAGDAVNDLDLAAGACRDATDAHNLILTALTKRSDATYVVGTNQGMLDTGAVGNSDYYLWAIKRSDTGVCDVLCSLSSTAPTMPTSYDFKRLIGWFKRTGGTIVACHTYETEGGGLELLWDVPTLDINLAATLTNARRTDAVKVPLNLSTTALLNVSLEDAGANVRAWIYCPDQTDTAPSLSAAPLSNIAHLTTGQGITTQAMRVRTSATGTIAARIIEAVTVDQYRVATVGFTWPRRT